MLIGAEELKQWLGYMRNADLVAWLQRYRIPYYTGKDQQPCTTLEAINLALCGTKQAAMQARF